MSASPVPLFAKILTAQSRLKEPPKVKQCVYEEIRMRARAKRGS
jgi:hypothetical protein